MMKKKLSNFFKAKSDQKKGKETFYTYILVLYPTFDFVLFLYVEVQRSKPIFDAQKPT